MILFRKYACQFCMEERIAGVLDDGSLIRKPIHRHRKQAYQTPNLMFRETLDSFAQYFDVTKAEHLISSALEVER
jgi:hypothetical protein